MNRILLRLIQWTGIVAAIWAAPTGYPAILASIGVVAVMVTSSIIGVMAYQDGRR